MFRIKHKKEVLRCAWDRCNKRIREFGYVYEDTGSIYCSEECAVRDETERAPPAMVLQ